MEVTSLTLGDLQTNCYLAWCETTREALIIDPADSGDFITDQILTLQLQPVGIVLTHGHFDHLLALLEVSLNFPVPVMMHQADVFLVQQAQRSAQHWLKRSVDPVPLPRTFFQEGDVLSFGQESLRVMEVPGHTPGSVALYTQEAIFTGDTLFAQGVGRTDFKYSDADQLQESVEKLHTLPASAVIFPGHGEAVRLDQAPRSITFSPADSLLG